MPLLPPGDQSKPAAAPARRRLLLAEDEEGVRLLFRISLEKAGYEVLAADDGDTAVALFRDNPDIAAVVLDLTMPRQGGLETLKKLRQLNPSVPVLLMSGYSHEELTERFGQSGFAGFLAKPFPTADLVAAAERMLAAAKTKP